MVCLLIAMSAATAAAQSFEHAVVTLWTSGDPAEANAAAGRLLASGRDWDELWRVLSERPRMTLDVEAGVHEDFHTTRDGERHHFAWVVPDGYDPAVPTAVRFVLHGGVSTTDRDKGAEGPIDNLRHLPWITVLPSAWREAPWWTTTQVENLAGILWQLKGRYNIDADRVGLQGISDGGGGVWFQAMLDATPWSSYLAVISHPGVLASAARGSQLHLVNLRNSPFLVINTVDDPLYPDRSVRPIMEFLADGGVDLSYVALAGHGHTTRWWPQERQRIDRFVARAVRDPHPSEILWAASDAAGGRYRWLIIEDPGAVPVDTTGDWNEFQGNPMFSRRRAYAQIALSRSANTVHLEGSGATRVRLLISPQVFDLDRPLIVENGGTRQVFELEADPAVLVRRFLVDRSPSMLYADEIVVQLQGSGSP